MLWKTQPDQTLKNKGQDENYNQVIFYFITFIIRHYRYRFSLGATIDIDNTVANRFVNTVDNGFVNTVDNRFVNANGNVSV